MKIFFCKGIAAENRSGDVRFLSPQIDEIHVLGLEEAEKDEKT